VLVKRIILTGGGSAGHVMPNIALLPELRKRGYDVHYIGSVAGIERQMISDESIPYYAIDTGKFRRYLDIRNVTDPFRVAHGLGQAALLMRRIRPHVLFAKGGFVSWPVIVAAWLNRVPAVIHESDLTVGMANRMSVPFVSRVCFSFPETAEFLPARKRVFTGTPVRDRLLCGNPEQGRRLCGFDDSKPVALVIGGSLGSKTINAAVRASLPLVLKRFQVCHICGKGGVDESLASTRGYRQFEFVSKELPDLMAAADVVISRAGANTIFELLALRKPNLLVPLSKSASRGDQIHNAMSFKRQGFSEVLLEEDLSTESLVDHVTRVYNGRKAYIQTMRMSPVGNGVDNIVKVIDEVCKADT
jgi:UDP-N-acetylglucosamine--N-acetylmuramyl-(pentapeptide) pyrophosphoryl-undecaprenol N-acetylglucosamine transferase